MPDIEIDLTSLVFLRIKDGGALDEILFLATGNQHDREVAIGEINKAGGAGANE
jgi:hypothetical protein